MSIRPDTAKHRDITVLCPVRHNPASTSSYHAASQQTHRRQCEGRRLVRSRTQTDSLSNCSTPRMQDVETREARAPGSVMASTHTRCSLPHAVPRSMLSARAQTAAVTTPLQHWRDALSLQTILGFHNYLLGTCRSVTGFCSGISERHSCQKKKGSFTAYQPAVYAIYINGR